MIPPCNLREYMEYMGCSLYASEKIIEVIDLEESVEIQELIRKTKDKYFKPPKKYSGEIEQTVSHILAWFYLEACLNDKDNEFLSIIRIEAVHEILMYNTDLDLKYHGKLREKAVRAGGHVFIDSKSVVPQLTDLLENLSKTLLSKEFDKSKHGFSLAAWFHFHFVSIHPFMDGNGRLTRLLTNYILRYCGCPVPVPLCSAESGITRSLYISSLEYGRLQPPSTDLFSTPRNAGCMIEGCYRYALQQSLP
ncbi:Fido domain-containing protein like protein [Aduncisulcus paluster]|uniref:Fido domain-containing protein like protein n=1 Tax=Aduncisulcus paluster TaxID=2918883 RepID=A0ABQ5KUP7_9EUKA|nr:Fido domain-containing protein like protein [Aduncisulcus paluster]